MILVSACLLGHKVKYNGRDDNTQELLLQYNERGHFLAVCPECFAMLPVPRPKREIQQGTGPQVMAGRAKAADIHAMDTTAYMLTGADKVLKIAEAYHAKVAILKEGSPSCGVHRIYDGHFNGTTVRGSGVSAALLQKHGITVYSEQDLTPELLDQLLAEDA